MHIGVDLGGINIAVGLVDKEYNIVNKGSVPTGRNRSIKEIVEDMAGLIEKVVTEANFTMKDVKTIGIGSPGTPDVVNKRILYMNNFEKFRNVHIEKELQEYFEGVTVHLENDANAAAYGEILAGAAKELDTAVVVTIGTGVGGGVIIDKKIYAGFNHAASELGHMVIKFDGKPCTCGRVGCLESYASATALIEQTKEKIKEYPDSIIHQMIDNNPENVNGKTAFDAAKQGDAAGQAIVDQFLEYLGVGLVNTINLFQPEAIVLGGGISKEGEYLLEPLRKYIKSFEYARDVPHTQLVTAKLGNDAGIIGAAMLWKQA